jgi:hypothetical protein
MNEIRIFFAVSILLAPAVLGADSEAPTAQAANLAAAVMNDYVRMSSADGFSNEKRNQWIAKETRFAPEFRKRYVLREKAAWKSDPELGWGADPILDAQDVPRGKYQPGKAELVSDDEVRGVLKVSDAGWKPVPFTAKRINGVWKISALSIIQ